MSEAPKRVRLDDYDCVWTEIADEALPEKGHWFISAAALRELCEKWEARAKTDYSLTHSPSCFASELLALLEGKD